MIAPATAGCKRGSTAAWLACLGSPLPSPWSSKFARDSRPFCSARADATEELDVAVRRFKKALIERALGGELPPHLGYPPGGSKPNDTRKHRNGSGGKTVLTDDGRLRIAVPRDRAGPFEPRLIAKHDSTT